MRKNKSISSYHTTHPYGMNRACENNVLVEALKEAICQVTSEKKVTIIQNLNININYASGGGATIVINKGKVNDKRK